jgi:rubrerythrin
VSNKAFSADRKILRQLKSNVRIQAYIPTRYKRENPMQKRWRCMICGYIHVGEEPPYVCPVCNAPRKMFERIGGDEKPKPEH